MELAQRSVDACQAELTSRSGEDTKRLKRIAVAEQLRAQVDTLERALADAEASARSALEDALSGHADAEVAYERAGSAVTALPQIGRASCRERGCHDV